MEFETDYVLKLFFSNPAFVQIYFEAVANALDAKANEVTIRILSDGNIKPKHLEVTISDNGMGFTDERFARFAEVKEPDDPYHKGFGRVIYLQYFSRVHVVSVFDGQKRTFTFSGAFTGDSQMTRASASDTQGTILRFSGFRGERLKSYDDIKPGALKERLLEHFLPCFHEKKKAGNSFKITVELEIQGRRKQKMLFPESQSITVADIPNFTCKVFRLDGTDAYPAISMSYMLQQGPGKMVRLTAVSVDGRTIPITLLHPNAIPIDWSAIFLFQSDLFVGKSDSSRQHLVLPESVSETVLYGALRREMSGVLSKDLPVIEQRNTATKKGFEERYPHLIGLFEEDTVGIIDKEEAIEIAQRRFFMKQKEVLESDSLDDVTFAKSLEVSSRTLTEYILYRECIIKQLSRITQHDKEAKVHNLIVPRYREFHRDGLIDGIYNNNAWLLDDKFMSFRTILSEAKMQRLISAITLSEDTVRDDGRPDISMIFSADPDQTDKVDVVVVEVKPRIVDNKEGPYAAIQLLERAGKLVDHCPNIQRIWYFAIIEIDDKLFRLLQTMHWIPLFSQGRVLYQDFPVTRADGTLVPTPVYLLSYDAVIQDAAARNHTFLEILKNDIKKAKVNSGNVGGPAGAMEASCQEE